MSYAATDLAGQGYIVANESLAQAVVTHGMISDYNAAVDLVLAMDFSVAETASELFSAEYASAMLELGMSVDELADASAALMSTSVVAEMAMTADTRPEGLALQEVLSNITVTQADADAYNDALSAVSSMAQISGAFFAASQNVALTDSIDSYVAANNITIGEYTAVNFVFDTNEYLITWGGQGEGTGWTQYTNDTNMSADELYSHSQSTMYTNPVSE
tara:strand:+ start:2941 stop:3594 length:654 start_codon:yes stop_codon:yes gene_type:complete